MGNHEFDILCLTDTEIILDSSVYVILYSFCSILMCVMTLYLNHHSHRVDGWAIRYGNISSLFESDIVYTLSYFYLHDRGIIIPSAITWSCCYVVAEIHAFLGCCDSV